MPGSGETVGKKVDVLPYFSKNRNMSRPDPRVPYQRINTRFSLLRSAISDGDLPGEACVRNEQVYVCFQRFPLAESCNFSQQEGRSFFSTNSLHRCFRYCH